MCTLINTNENEKKSANNNGFSFPVFSGETNHEYNSKSTICEDYSTKFNIQKNTNFYCINIDWFEIVCKTLEPLKYIFSRNQNNHIQIESKSVCNNTYFLKHYKIYFYGDEAFDVYSKPKKPPYKRNEVLIKVNNKLLYSNKYYCYLLELMNVFGFTYVRFNRLDIALDGVDILKLIEILNKYGKSHTVQINNDAISILPTKFNKKELRYPSYAIGKNKSGLSATVYNKSDEIEIKNKHYITDYWEENNIDIKNVGRFEIRLNSKYLRKYNLNVKDIEQLTDASFIGSIFTNEVKPWLKFYRVRKSDFLKYKKETAIKKGRKIRFIRWNKIPTKMESLKTIDYVSNNFVVSARNSIAFNLRDILLHPNTTTTAQVEIITKYAVDYGLVDYTKNKIIYLFENNNANPYKKRLYELDFNE